VQLSKLLQQRKGGLRLWQGGGAEGACGEGERMMHARHHGRAHKQSRAHLIRVFQLQSLPLLPQGLCFCLQ